MMVRYRQAGDPPTKRRRLGRLVHLVHPQFGDAYATLYDTATGGLRCRPFADVQVLLTGPRGGKRWRELVLNLDDARVQLYTDTEGDDEAGS